MPAGTGAVAFRSVFAFVVLQTCNKPHSAISLGGAAKRPQAKRSRGVSNHALHTAQPENLLGHGVLASDIIDYGQPMVLEQTPALAISG
jgi:hypothetical protein